MRILLLALLLIPTMGIANTISVVHSNYSQSEAKAYSILQNSLAEDNLIWVDQLPVNQGFPSADQVKSIVEQNPSQASMAQIHGKELERWYDLGVVRHLTTVAESNRWRDLLPEFIYKKIQHRGQIIAVPSGLHITNTLWANKKIIDNTGLSLDSSWDNFLNLLAKIEETGITPIVMIDNVQFDTLLFESLLLSEVGAEAYNASMLDLDSTALRAIEPAFERVFQKLDALKPFISRLPEDTNIVTVVEAIVSGQAAITLQGSWIQGEFTFKGLLANQQYYCAQVPGQHEGVIFMLDTFAALSTSDIAAQQKQAIFANKVLDKNNQFLMNNYSGAHAVVPDTGLEKLNECNAAANNRLTEATATKQIVGSTAMGMNLPVQIGDEVLEIIHTFMTTNASAADTASHLRKRMKYGSFLIN
ncbi:hypothetical protein [Reinekea sp.]|jgi:glucose/mannose transport system substrate-binding protein|uniref:hypothetical protein n=1 Tax=Reinekea sp. TaxID=1970455 RepID=UPI00398A48C9